MIIHKANSEHIEKWVKFNRDNYGKRFKHNGETITKWEAFRLFELYPKMVTRVEKVDSDYHKRIVNIPNPFGK